MCHLPAHSSVAFACYVSPVEGDQGGGLRFWYNSTKVMAYLFGKCSALHSYRRETVAHWYLIIVTSYHADKSSACFEALRACASYIGLWKTMICSLQVVEILSQTIELGVPQMLQGLLIEQFSFLVKRVPKHRGANANNLVSAMKHITNTRREWPTCRIFGTTSPVIVEAYALMVRIQSRSSPSQSSHIAVTKRFSILHEITRYYTLIKYTIYVTSYRYPIDYYAACVSQI